MASASIVLFGANGQPIISRASTTPVSPRPLDAHGAPIAAPVREPLVPAPARHRTATQPTKAAVASGTVGAYVLVPGNGTYSLYHAGTGDVVPEAFTDQGDAAWYAQRLTRLAEIRAERGRLFQPKIELPVGWSIRGKDGALTLHDDTGAQIGPVWTSPDNGRVDAFRYAQRVTRKAGAA